MIRVILTLITAFYLSLNGDVINMIHHPDPPYNIPETEDGLKGIEVELVESIMAKRGHTVKIKHVPYIRMHKEFEEGKADGVTTVQEGSFKDVFFSQPYISYENVYITLPSYGIEVDKINFDKKLKLGSFRNAHKYMGDEYATLTKNLNELYREESQSITLVRKLYKKRLDMVMIDRRIFLYFRKQTNNVDVSEKPRFFNVFAPTHFRQRGEMLSLEMILTMV